MIKKFLNSLNTVLSPVKAMSLHFYGSIVGSLLVLLLFFFIRDYNENMKLARKNIQFIALIISCISGLLFFLFARRHFYQGVMNAKQNNLSVSEKLSKYHVAIFRYIYLCEMGAMVSFIGFFVTGNKYCIIPGFVMIALMFLKRPTKERIFNDLEMDTKEQMEVN